MNNKGTQKTITNEDIKRIYDETISDDTPASDFQKERVLIRLGRTPQNIEFVKVMNYSFAQKLLDFYKEQSAAPLAQTQPEVCKAPSTSPTQGESQAKTAYFCPICKHGFDSPKRANGCLDIVLLVLFVGCLTAIPFTFGASIIGCVLWAALSITCCAKVCPYCSSKNFFKQNITEQNTTSANEEIERDQDMGTKICISLIVVFLFICALIISFQLKH